MEAVYLSDKANIQRTNQTLSYELRTLLNSLANIEHTLLDNTDFSLTQILLFGNTTFNANENTKITKGFDEPLL